ncbi:MAG: PIG-L family deacetylase [Acidimicrobiales bacterium]
MDLDGIGRVVVVAPHPDDESLACGMLLAAAAAGRIEIRVIAVTDGEAAYPGLDPAALAALRRAEQEAALAELGVAASALSRLGLPDGAVADHTDELAAAIAPHLERRTLLVAPSIHDWHPDHEACGLAATGAAAGTDGPVWSSLFWAHHHPEKLLASAPTFARFAGTAAHAQARHRAIRCHQTQLTAPATDIEPILTPERLGHLESGDEYYVVERR